MALHPTVRDNPVRQRRVAAGLIQIELAKRAGLTPSRVCHLERGLLARDYELARVARALRCTLADVAPLDQVVTR